MDIRVHDICSVGSSQITTHILWDIGIQVQKVFYEGSNGVVITHGTDTMEETAYFLDLMSGSTAKKDAEGEEDDTNAVSYTHLDVYKRQLFTPGAGP